MKRKIFGELMKKRISRITWFFVTCFLLLTQPVECWLDGGHMLVAQVAYNHLDPEVKERVDVLSEAFAFFYPEHQSFITSSTWMDYVRCKGGLYIFDTWHYVDIPYDPEGVLTPEQKEKLLIENETHSVIEGIQQAKKTLRGSRASTFEKALMLRVLIHCVGDIHTPLHTTSRYTPELLNGDRGGNGFKLKGEHKNLHVLWDTGFGEWTDIEMLPVTEELLQFIKDYAKDLEASYPADGFPFLHVLDPKAWAREGHTIAVEEAYSLPEGQAPSKEYLIEGRETARQRIVLAGYRLAILLNEIFK